jgi:hypothetical protein
MHVLDADICNRIALLKALSNDVLVIARFRVDKLMNEASLPNFFVVAKNKSVHSFDHVHRKRMLVFVIGSVDHVIPYEPVLNFGNLHIQIDSLE